MRRCRVWSLLVGLSLWSACQRAGLAQNARRIESVAQHYAAKDGYSGTVTVAHKGKVVFRHAYGFADREHRSVFDEHTRFNIGSISKQFTAAAILLLQEEGKLKTGDRLGQVLPKEDLPQTWSGITLRQLLSHTSGLKDYFGQALTQPSGQRSTTELLGLVRDAPLDFKPGEGYSYSNTNYLLLGMVVQTISGMPFGEFLHRRLFEPAGLRDTQCLRDAGSEQHHALGYAPVDPGEGKPLAEDPPAAVVPGSLLLGAGEMISTGDDLVRWTDALHHGRVLSEASYREMTTPVRNGYGYGLQMGSLREHLRIDHSGSVPGFYSELEYFPGSDDIVVILSNQNALSKGLFTPGTHEIDSELMTMATEPNALVPSEGREVPHSPQVLRHFTGRYVSDDGKAPPFTITLQGSHLQLLQEGPGHSPSVLRGEYGELNYYLADSEAELQFDGENEATVFDLRYSRALPFHRVQP